MNDIKNMNDRLYDSPEWRQVVTEQDWKELDNVLKGGDDGIIKDLHWSNQAFVDSQLRMVFDGEPYLGLLIQLQNEPASVEFVLTGVKEINLVTTHDLLLSMSITPGVEVILELSGEGRSRIVASEMFYRIPAEPMLGDERFDIEV